VRRFLPIHANPAVVKVHFGPALSQLFTGQKLCAAFVTG